MLPYDKIIHIVPEYPPLVGGVSDFSHIIKESMQAWDIPQSVLVAGIKSTSCQFDEDVVIVKDAGGLEVSIQEKIGVNTLVVFHYVCYGYSLKGIPVFLPGIIGRIKKKFNVTMLTYFHELYASESSPLKSAFWLGFIQKKLAQKISYLSDIRITTSVNYKLELDEWNPLTTFQNIYMPVFSNIPEYSNWKELDKQNQVVVFGSKGARNKVYKKKDILDDLIKKMSACNWVDIGATVDAPDSIEQLGKLSATEVSKVLALSTWGLIEYDNMPIEKSGVFAAYILNGVVPIVLNCNTAESAYKPGIHFVLYNDFEILSQERAQEIRVNAFRKYKEIASVEMHIEKIQDLLRDLVIT